jgi:hypothetical protein
VKTINIYISFPRFFFFFSFLVFCLLGPFGLAIFFLKFVSWFFVFFFFSYTQVCLFVFFFSLHPIVFWVYYFFLITFCLLVSLFIFLYPIFCWVCYFFLYIFVFWFCYFFLIPHGTYMRFFSYKLYQTQDFQKKIEIHFLIKLEHNLYAF